MSKEINNSFSKKILYIFSIILVVGLVGAAVWYYQGNVTIKGAPKIAPQEKKEKTVFDNYQATSQSINGANYFRLSDVICEAAPSDKDSETHYFKIGLTFKTNSKDDLKLLESKKEDIVGMIRSAVGYVRLGDFNNENMLSYVKVNVKNAVNHMLGSSVVSDVYFEELVGQ